MLDDNFFADFFNNLGKKPEQYVEQLNEYWRRGQVDQYYNLLNECKQRYRVMRNSVGLHKVEER